MVDFRPFPGWRPPPALAAQVAALPYDVMNRAEAREMAAGNPLSLLHVTRPDIDLPDDADAHGDAAYAQALHALHALLGQGGLRQDALDCYYAYAQTMDGRRQVGLMGVASAAEYWGGRIKRHELTRADKEEDRVRHVRTLSAHMGPVFLTYRAQSAIDAHVAEVTAAEPTVDFVAPDGIRHQLWPIRDAARLDALRGLFSGLDALYIADGHHRAAAAARVGKDAPEGDPAGHFLACAFPHDQLCILPYFRVLLDLNGHTPAGVRAALEQDFVLTPLAGPEAATERHTFTVGIRGEGWFRLGLRDPASVNEADPVARLDVSILQSRVLAPLFGIDDPRTSKRIDFVGGIRGVGELEKRLGADAQVVFALYPTTLDDLMDISDAGQIMPPKSTWFEPKLRSGMVVSRFRV
jgi:uncharacterized protein (DUF1015 family)